MLCAKIQYKSDAKKAASKLYECKMMVKLKVSRQLWVMHNLNFKIKTIFLNIGMLGKKERKKERKKYFQY